MGYVNFIKGYAKDNPTDQKDLVLSHDLKIKSNVAYLV